jgi:RHS repeat-associated protein
VIDFDPQGWEGDALDGVYREVSVDGVSYQYLYDAFGRRRQKIYSDGSDVEFFYDDSKMIEDRGTYRSPSTLEAECDIESNDAVSATDEYIWLDGKPVVMIRALLSKSSGTQLENRVDSTDEEVHAEACNRGDGVDCGVYFLVNDPIGKPVLVINGEGKVAGEAEYTPFGMPNRVTTWAETAHPYALGISKKGDLLASLRETPASASERVSARARFTEVSTPAGSSDRVLMSFVDGGVVAYEEASYAVDAGQTGGALVSQWIELGPAGVLQARFDASTGGTFGAVVSGFDYRRYQDGATPAWTHLGLPGQYYDPETDLFENWHRYYDANTGRYLEPDPIWKYPEQLVPRLASGHFDPIYAYAGNNPLGSVDPTGLVGDGTNDVQQVRTMADGTSQLIEECSDGNSQACTVLNVERSAAAAAALAPFAVALGAGDLGAGLSAIASRTGASLSTAWAAVQNFLSSGPGQEGTSEAEGAAPEIVARIRDTASTTAHIFRDAEGHFPEDTAGARAMIEETATAVNSLGRDIYSSEWFARTVSGGYEVWAQARNGVIVNGGINNVVGTAAASMHR